MIAPIPSLLSWSHRHRAVVILAVLCLVVVAAAGLRQLRFDTDVLALLPHDGRAVPAFRTFVRAFAGTDRLFVVLTAPPGHPISDYTDRIDTWAERLRTTPGITRLDTGVFDGSRDLTWFADRRLLLLSDERLDLALQRFAGGALHQQLQRQRGVLTVPSPAVAQMIRYDPLGLFQLLRDELGAAQSGVNVGVTEGGYVSSDGRSRLLIAEAGNPFDAAFSRGLMASLEALRREMAQSEAVPSGGANADDERPPLQAQFAGGHRIAVETEAIIRRESIVNTVAALALILPLLYVVFRSPWLVLVGSIPSAVALVVVLGVLGMTGATLSAAATASSAMLFGLGVDGVVLLYVAYTHALRTGAAPAAAIVGLSGPAASMLLGMWTTAATFYGLTFVDFPSLEQLGALIGHSMLICGVLTLVLVPALLPRRRPTRMPRALALPRFAAWVDRHRRAIIAATLVLTAIMAAAALRLQLNPTLDRLRAVTPGAVLLQQIGPTFGLPDDAYLVVASGPELDPLLAANERLRQAVARALPGVAMRAPSALLPSVKVQQDRQARIRNALGDAAAAGETITAAERAEGFREGSFAPFRERLPAMLDANLHITYDGFNRHDMDDLMRRFVVPHGDGWLLASYTFPKTAADVATLERTVAGTDPSAVVTGLAAVNRELADRFLPEFLKGLAIGSLIVVGLVLLAFRDWRLTLLSLAPTAIGLVWAAGMLALIGATLDLFALFAVVTFVGIGVDYGVHLVHRYHERGDATQAVAELAPVILVAALITLLGYGTLVTSSYPPLRSIGLVSAVSVATLAVASLVALPAILAAISHGRQA